eukprot:CAMPEP_0172741498 /NCGR_PEP_ID=MMETSP1074-20121228/127351_1 /TAXON_ID=2916 /ORGANISM="Ceratium fusus, Strain PA161109" /LENGTH=113 /DNA_ID=CAMNT_0013571821 /DNA_START=53 /DNA_END=395 /DNA_ORIENTATION=-
MHSRDTQWPLHLTLHVGWPMSMQANNADAGPLREAVSPTILAQKPLQARLLPRYVPDAQMPLQKQPSKPPVTTLRLQDLETVLKDKWSREIGVSCNLFQLREQRFDELPPKNE